MQIRPLDYVNIASDVWQIRFPMRIMIAVLVSTCQLEQLIFRSLNFLTFSVDQYSAIAFALIFSSSESRLPFCTSYSRDPVFLYHYAFNLAYRGLFENKLPWLWNLGCFIPFSRQKRLLNLSCGHLIVTCHCLVKQIIYLKIFRNNF